MKTFVAKPHEIHHKWYIIDAKNQCLGRLAVDIARILRGKHKPEYTPHVDTGDYVVVVNAGQIAVTGNKTTDKMYYRHSGYVGGLKKFSFQKMQDYAPGRVLELAVKGMLPKGPLGRDMFRKLKLFPGEKHDHAAQMPQALPSHFIFRT